MSGMVETVGLQELSRHLPSLGLPEELPDYAQSHDSSEAIGAELEGEIMRLMPNASLSNPRSELLPVDHATIAIAATKRRLAPWQVEEGGYETGMAYSLAVTLPLTFEGSSQQGFQSMVFSTWHESYFPEYAMAGEKPKWGTFQAAQHTIHLPKAPIKAMFGGNQDTNVVGPDRLNIHAKQESELVSLEAPFSRRAFGVGIEIAKHMTVAMLYKA